MKDLTCLASKEGGTRPAGREGRAPAEEVRERSGRGEG